MIMKDWEYNVLLVLSVCCLILAVWIIGVGRGNERLQSKLQGQQMDIERGNMSRQMGSRIIHDMITAGSTNSSMRVILEKYGFVPQADVSSKAVKIDKQAVPLVKPKGSKNAAGKQL